jgi:hypothetical protein
VRSAAMLSSSRRRHQFWMITQPKIVAGNRQRRRQFVREHSVVSSLGLAVPELDVSPGRV